MTHSDSGGAPWRLIIIQVLVLTGLLIFFKFYLPHHERNLAAQAAAAREDKIDAFFHGSVTEDTERDVTVPLNGVLVKRHPKRLRTTFSPDEAESLLGVPNTSAIDFRGGQHLTWLGTAHKVEAAFDAGRLFCLTLEDLKTRQGEQVFKTDDLWRPY